MKKVILVLIFFFSALTVFGEDTAYERESLKGLVYFGVIVSLDGDVPGLTLNQIIIDIGLKLRMIGLDIVEVRNGNEASKLSVYPA